MVLQSAFTPLPVAALIAGTALLPGQARADTVADFYRGKTINVYIGVNVGGGYDFEARLLARFMRAHIPGNPVLVPQNMIGAGGAQYDANRFSWIGSMTTSPLTFATWHTTGVTTIEEARRRELTVAASN